MQWAPGTTAELTVTFTKDDGTPIDPDEVTVDLYDTDSLIVDDDGTPERVSLGLWKYEWEIPEDAVEGLYRIEWHAVITPDGEQTMNVYGDELFEVGVSITVTPAEPIQLSRLRARLAEMKSDPDSDGTETFFSDVDLADIYAYADNDLDAATLEGWRRKLARYARLVDISESGSERKMSQKFKNAAAMVKFWSDLIGEGDTARQTALAGRVVGKPINLRDWLGTPNLRPSEGYAQHIRLFPTHRLLLPFLN